MPTFVTIGYGDRAGYDQTDPRVRKEAHAHDARMSRDGVDMGVARSPVQVRNHDAAGVAVEDGPYLRSHLPVAGFALIEAGSLDEAIQLVAGTPCAVAHGVVEVWPLEPTRPSPGPGPGPEWKYVNLRRYLAYLERSIDQATRWATFEPNDERLWAAVRESVTDFLYGEWREGGLQGDRAELAFFVQCDRSTMTQSDVDNGRLVIEVGVAPVKPAEFVIFRIGQWTAAIDPEPDDS